jgi:hypothetical protein
MSKMGSHDPFEHLKHKLWPKERPGVKLVVWFPITKRWEPPWFPCVQVACNTPLESSQEGLQLCFKPHSNHKSIRKVMGPQCCKNPSCQNFRTPGTKCHLDVGFVERHIIYYKGEGDGFLQVRVVMSLVNMSSLVVRPRTKSAQTMH